MNETLLMKLALTCIVIGLPAFYALTQFVPLETPPETVTGVVTAINTTTITISQLVALPTPLDVALGTEVSVQTRNHQVTKLKVD
ncbi:hypothetical protein HY492_00750 [Candidatus Woesearchaeota archaeon]|nr:hypothetical protein [Candidatus Woesearchaeota archaeon]